MQIEFRQEMNRKYMVLVPDQKEEKEDSYILRMVTENSIEGVLPCVPAMVDNQRMYYYDVSGLVPIQDYLKDHSVTDVFISKLILSLAKLLDELQTFLIPGNCIVTGPGVTFTESGGSKIHFAVFQTDSALFVSGMQKLSEVLISKLSNSDPRTAAAGYGFYQLCISGNITASNLRKILEGRNPEPDRKKPQHEPARMNRKMPDIAAFGKASDAEKGPKKTWKTRFTEIWKRFLSRIRKDPQKTYKASKRDDELDLLSELIGEKKDVRMQADRQSPGTVYIGKDPGEKEKSLPVCTLLPVDTEYGDVIFLEEEVCRIGRSHSYADAVVRDETVSRVHAVLRRAGETYMVQDCGSTNGTKVNGQPVSKDLPVRLSDGDRILFGTAEYFFQINDSFY